MEVIHSLSKIDRLSHMTGVSLGSFDGIHKGHLTLINSLVENCRKKNLKSVIYTFSNHPRGVINTKNSPKIIISKRQKVDLFKEIGIDFLFMVDFDDFQRNISAEDFVAKILLEKLNMSSMTVGTDCRFGKKAEGDIILLEQFSKDYSFDLTIVPPVKLEDKIISSTAIRHFLSQGLIEKANMFLGRNYSIIGKVIKGKQLGSKLGFPTANISIDFNMSLPKPGVYVSKTKVGNRVYNSITNVGFNPTFNQKNYNIETYILEFNKNIYGEEVEVHFLHRIRDEIKFNSIDDLCDQINKDIIYSKEYFKTFEL
ncbi:bifunctional riboflavin kinase/FAD synthetase [Wukongibacter baidiensis]|uniref:bifunctional riboflavin kinase/FAD synthetase n=1 Tax=Wukongibacter baidiensis TaxID=1723361 RepID=UPI003D7F38D6